MRASRNAGDLASGMRMCSRSDGGAETSVPRRPCHRGERVLSTPQPPSLPILAGGALCRMALSPSIVVAEKTTHSRYRRLLGRTRPPAASEPFVLRR